ncbi:uncharacterized protein PFL1_04233 [Pseudozyma flocculosa PF-1]|uniref:Secreted protein n=1 Tax=Pseudozyma flocculosa PF-1 TaxID=1277687 RepID=A0A061HCS9_9BASI|nr:uncharacterized protein PFL1_04233 [Pseudozyma flocculosa PF-1]EPQ28406.1 hypothetical protein PFL1_04233 [Pseudozyma flocculosa PF-1]
MKAAASSVFLVLAFAAMVDDNGNTWQWGCEINRTDRGILLQFTAAGCQPADGYCRFGHDELLKYCNQFHGKFVALQAGS